MKMKKGPQDIFGVVLTHPKRSQELTHTHNPFMPFVENPIFIRMA
jgi:hypothetical protein